MPPMSAFARGPTAAVLLLFTLVYALGQIFEGFFTDLASVSAGTPPAAISTHWHFRTATAANF